MREDDDQDATLAPALVDCGTGSVFPSGGGRGDDSHSTEGDDAVASATGPTSSSLANDTDAVGDSTAAGVTDRLGGSDIAAPEKPTRARPIPTAPDTPAPLTSPHGKRSGPCAANGGDGGGHTRATGVHAPGTSDVVSVAGQVVHDTDVAASRVAQTAPVSAAGAEDAPASHPTDAGRDEGAGLAVTVADANEVRLAPEAVEAAGETATKAIRPSVTDILADADRVSDSGSSTPYNGDAVDVHRAVDRTDACGESIEAPRRETDDAELGDKVTEEACAEPPGERGDTAPATHADGNVARAPPLPLPTSAPATPTPKPRLGGRGAPPHPSTPGPSRWVSMSERPRAVSQTMAMAMTGGPPDDLATNGVTEPGPCSLHASPAPVPAGDVDDEWVAFVRAQLVRLFPDFHKYASGAGSVGASDDGDGDGRADESSDDGHDGGDDDGDVHPLVAPGRSFRAELAALRDEIAQLRGVVGEVAGSGYAAYGYTADVDGEGGVDTDVPGGDAVHGTLARGATPPLPESVVGTPLPSAAFVLPQPDPGEADADSDATDALSPAAIAAALDIVRLLDAASAGGPGGLVRSDTDVFAPQNLSALAEVARMWVPPLQGTSRVEGEDVTAPQEGYTSDASADVVHENDAPHANTPRADTLHPDSPRTDPPCTDRPCTEPPCTDPPCADPPCTEPPCTDPPRTDLPRADPPRADTPPPCPRPESTTACTPHPVAATAQAKDTSQTPTSAEDVAQTMTAAAPTSTTQLRPGPVAESATESATKSATELATELATESATTHHGAAPSPAANDLGID